MSEKDVVQEDLVLFLQKHRMKLLDEQLVRAQRFVKGLGAAVLGDAKTTEKIEGVSSGRRVVALVQVIEWGCSAVNVDAKNDMYWTVLSDSCKILSLVERGLSFISNKSGSGVLNGMKNRLESSGEGELCKEELEWIFEILTCLIGHLGFNPQPGGVCDLLECLGDRLAREAERDSLTNECLSISISLAQRILAFLSEQIDPLAPRRIFDTAVNSLLCSFAHLRNGLSEVLVLHGEVFEILPKLGVGSQISPSARTSTIPGTLRLEVLATIAQLDRTIGKTLFQPIWMDQFEDNLVAWEILLEGGDRATVERKQRPQNGQDQSKQKRNRPTAFTGSLLTKLGSLLQDNIHKRQVQSFIPCIFEQFARCCQNFLVPNEKPVENEDQASKKRKRPLVRTSKQLKFFFEFSQILLKASSTTEDYVHSFVAIAKLLRLVIEFDLYDVSNQIELDMFVSWTQSSPFQQVDRLVNGQSTVSGDVHDLVSMQVVLVSCLLEVDHRIFHNQIDELFRFAYQDVAHSFTHLANGKNKHSSKLSHILPSGDPFSEIILRITDNYSRLRQIEILLPLFAEMLDRTRDEDGAFRVLKFFAQNETLLPLIGQYFSRIPPGQILACWDVCESMFETMRAGINTTAGQQKFLLASIIVKAFIEALHVNENNVMWLRNKAKTLQNTLLTELTLHGEKLCSQGTLSPRHLPSALLVCGMSVVLQSTLSILRICDTWKHTSTEAATEEALISRDSIINVEIVLILGKARSLTTPLIAKEMKFEQAGANELFAISTCKIAAHVFRSQAAPNSEKRSKKQDLELLRIFLGDTATNVDILMEHINVIELCENTAERDKVAVDLWGNILMLTIDEVDAPEQRSPLCNAFFFELFSFKNTFVQGVLQLIRNRPQDESKIFSLISVFPRQYISTDVALQIGQHIFEHAGESMKNVILSPGVCELLTTFLDIHPREFLGKFESELFNLNFLERVIENFADAGPGIPMIHKLGSAAASFNIESLASAVSRSLQLYNTSQHNTLLFALLEGMSSTFQRKRAPSQKKSYFQTLNELTAQVFKFASNLAPGSCERALLLTFLLNSQSRLVKCEENTSLPFQLGLADTLAMETLANLKASTKIAHHTFLSAMCSVVRTLPDFKNLENFSVLTNAIFEAKLASENSSTPVLDQAALQLCRNADSATQLPFLFDFLESKLQLATVPSTQQNEMNIRLISTAVSLLAVLCPCLNRGVRLEKFEKKSRASLLNLLLSLSYTESSPLCGTYRLKCLKIISSLAQHSVQFWKGENLTKARLVLTSIEVIAAMIDASEGQSAEEDQVNAGIFKECVIITFSIMRIRKSSLGYRCSLTLVSLIRTLASTLVRNLTGKASCPNQAWEDGAKFLVRICEFLPANQTIYRHHAVYWLLEYISIRESVLLPDTIYEELKLMSFNWLDMCTDYDLQQTHISSDPSGRVLFKELREDHERNHLFTGKI